jgi:prepilin-type N-terminal cleavage/methylation domain-containing protein
MLHVAKARRGYSLIEVLVVLSIVGILAMVGLSSFGSRENGGVRSIMDEIEGTLANAQSTAVITSQDVYLSTQGTWVGGDLLLDGRPLNNTVAYPPSATDVAAGDDTKRSGSSSECFRSHFQNQRDHMSAGVATTAAWYTTALGTATDLKNVPVVSALTAAKGADLVGALGNRLFTGSANYVIVNGYTKRFETGFSVVVIGLSAGAPAARGALGVLVVPAGGSTIYKFFKPSGSDTWRRL